MVKVDESLFDPYPWERRRGALSDKTIAEVRELYAEGYSVSVIAESLGIGRAAASACLRKAKSDE